MNAPELIKQYQENQGKLKVLETQSDEFYKAKQGEARQVELVFWEQERIIKQERDKEFGLINEQKRIYEEKAKQERVELSEVIHEVERIMAYLKLENRNLEIDIATIKHYDRNKGKYLEWLDYLYYDDFLKIRLLIVENDKPKNKYNLCALGKCLFHDGFLKIPRGYGLNLTSYNSGCNIEIIINNFDSIDKLKGWLGKNPVTLREKILKGFLTAYQEVKAEYLDAITNYRIEDFQEIIDTKEVSC